jgi:hypothetical protein
MIIEPYLGRFIIRTGAKRARYMADQWPDGWTTRLDRAAIFNTMADAQAVLDRLCGK